MAYKKVIILGEEEKCFLAELLSACNEENQTNHNLNPNDTMILNCLCNKVN